MAKRIGRDVKAVSPVIATIIIVAVAIVMSIAVAYWMLGLATTFTRYEKLEFVSAYAVKGKYLNETSKFVPVFNITITVKNTGSSPATVTKFLLNGIPDDVINTTSAKLLNYSRIMCGLIVLYDGNKFNFTKTTVTINPGETQTFKIIIADGAKVGNGIVTSGISLEIVVQTAAGNQYPKTIVLP
ncbi:MAG: archaellin/type IV pilin N-terminal domain-containing protein [Candidatus Bathyarchaeia archaeon]